MAVSSQGSPRRSIWLKTSPRLRSRIATIWSISSAVTTSGGPKAIQCGSNRHKRPWAKARRPTWTPNASRVGKSCLGRAVAHEFDGLKEPLAANIADYRIFVGQRYKARTQSISLFTGIGQQVALENLAQYGESGRARDRVAFKCVPLDKPGVGRDRSPERVGDRPSAYHCRQRRIPAA